MDAGLKNKFDQILKIDDVNERFEDENQVVPYLRMLTDYRYTVEITTHRRWGSEDSALQEGRFYQIVPDRVDNGYFDWYCDNRPDHQHFKTVEMALLHFVFYWHVWMKEGKVDT
jgi:hypothetical protein